MSDTSTDFEAQARAAAREWRPEGRVRSLSPLTGGTSGPAFRLDVELSEGPRSVVWRRPYEASSARIEFNVLQRAYSAALPVPEPLAFSDDGWSLMAFVPGGLPQDHVQAAVRCAECLAAVHRLDVTGLTLPSAQARLARYAAGESPHAELLRRCMPAHAERPVLLHGDLWPGNTIWNNDDTLAALIDWESAMLGDPWADISAARLEILWAWGRPAMDAFTQRFAELTPSPPLALPAWEIAAVLRLEPALPLFGLSPEEENRHRTVMAEFLTEARNRIEQ